MVLVSLKSGLEKILVAGIGYVYDDQGKQVLASTWSDSIKITQPYGESAAIDVTEDSPMNDAATFIQNASNGNLNIGGANFGELASQNFDQVNKYYWEEVVTAGANGNGIGVYRKDNNLSAYYAGYDGGVGGSVFSSPDTGVIAYGKRFREGDVVGCYYDSAKNAIGFTVNGEDQGGLRIKFQKTQKYILTTTTTAAPAHLLILTTVRFLSIMQPTIVTAQ